MATNEELEREVSALKLTLARYVQFNAQVRVRNAQATLVGMGISGIIFGMAGYLLGSRNGMRRGREMMK